jgi:hypothetical protein
MEWTPVVIVAMAAGAVVYHLAKWRERLRELGHVWVLAAEAAK